MKLYVTLFIELPLESPRMRKSLCDVRIVNGVVYLQDFRHRKD